MKVAQILPELNAGGVELCTLELSTLLVQHGHEPIVISNGGTMVAKLEQSGVRHVTMPVHRKSLRSLFQVRKLRAWLRDEKPDIVHAHSRVPAWIAWLALRGMDPLTRPKFITTVHGFYSVNAYSAIMTKGDRVIAVSESIRKYILKNYPSCPLELIRVIHHGIEQSVCGLDYRPSTAWLSKWQAEHPEFLNKQLLLLPGRITRWKGQEDFIRLIAKLKNNNPNIHGLIAGDTHPKKRAFAAELHTLAMRLGVAENLTFLGHRSDIHEVMAASDIVLSLSRDPEAFGRVTLEAMALGKPVVGYDHGGVSEQLNEIFPRGKVPPGDSALVATRITEILGQPTFPTSIGHFTQQKMFDATVATYGELFGKKP